MATVAKICLQSLLKAVNSTLGMLGIAMILYGLWLVRVWLRDMDPSPYDHPSAPSPPWFICTFLGAGVFLCAITCLGHLAAKFAYGSCLSCYMFIVFLVLLLEAAVAADIFLNSDWERDLPHDPTGKFEDFKDFVSSNFDMFQWVAIFILLTQGFSILLAIALRSMGPDEEASYDSEEDCPQARLPLINHNGQLPEYSIAAKK